MTPWLALGAGAVAGLASLAHCVAMCGPLSLFAASGGRRGGTWWWQAGRLAAYGVLGAAAGTLGHVVTSWLQAPILGAVLSWGIAVVLLLTARKLWRGPAAARAQVETIGKQPRTPLLTRALAVLPRHPAVLGAGTALLPCGALAAAVVLAAGTGSPTGGVASMLGFGAASGVGLLLTATIAAQLRGMGRGATRLLAAGLVAGAAVLIWRPIPTLLAGPGEAPCPMHGHAGSS